MFGSQVKSFKRKYLLGMAAALGVFSVSVPAHAEQLKTVHYLLAAPETLPAYAPWVLADKLGYYAKAGYDVKFSVGQGGVDVAKQIGAGNADLGSAMGDTPIIVRPNGIKIKNVALMGGGALTVITVRPDAGVKTLKDLKGKTIAVISYQDTTYYATIGALAAVGVNKNQVHFEAVGPAGVTMFVKSGKAQACGCTPDWSEANIKVALPNALVFPTQDYFPSMAQSIVASDAMIKKDPQMIRAVVQATLKGMELIQKDPVAAADEYIKFEPMYADKRDYIIAAFKAYAKYEYKPQAVPGEIDPATLAKLEQFYLAHKIVQKSTPVSELYTNQFVQN